jgi:hypothetical protein
MERAIGAYAGARGVSPANLDARWTLVRDYDFDSVGKHMSHVWQALDHAGYIVAAKGALEGILAHTQIDEGARRAAVDATANSLRRACECSRSRPSAWTGSGPTATRTTAI